MINEKDDEQRIKRITIVEGTTDDQFLEESFYLGSIATGLGQIEEAIKSCECEGVDLVSVKKEFPADYKKAVQFMKKGKLDDAFDIVKVYMTAYKAAHLLVLNEDDNDKLESILNGPLCGTPSNEKILH